MPAGSLWPGTARGGFEFFHPLVAHLGQPAFERLGLGRWVELDDAEQPFGSGAVGLALLAVWGLEFQPVTKRHGLATLCIEPLFEFAPVRASVW